jgi:hypothetical protein
LWRRKKYGWRGRKRRSFNRQWAKISGLCGKDFGLKSGMSVSKKIVLGVTGSIAAHKAADLASLLTKAKCDVRVVMTADA